MSDGSPWGAGWGSDGSGRGSEGRANRGRASQNRGAPPWLAGLFGLVHQESGGQRARRGDVRAAILDVLATGPMNGYQVIQQIAERSRGAWRPSPGSVYPTLAQLEDEGLITGDEVAGPRAMRLTGAGETYVAEHLEELGEVWASFSRASNQAPDYTALKPELGQLMSAVWQIITQGTDKQRRDAISLLTDTRRKLYLLLAEEDSPVDSD
ncbi:MAG: PadR family transcriptional regulator [Nocardioides sp.]